jgi:hypothetical protein
MENLQFLKIKLTLLLSELKCLCSNMEQQDGQVVNLIMDKVNSIQNVSSQLITNYSLKDQVITNPDFKLLNQDILSMVISTVLIGTIETDNMVVKSTLIEHLIKLEELINQSENIINKN